MIAKLRSLVFFLAVSTVVVLALTQTGNQSPSSVQSASPAQSPSQPQASPPQTSPRTQASAPAPSSSPAPEKNPDTRYSLEAVILVITILVLLGLLFWFLIKYWHYLDQASYLGSVYRESVEDFEYKRLAAVPTEKFERGGYLDEVAQDGNWLANNRRPKHPEGIDDPYLYHPSWRMGSFRPGGTPPPGLGTVILDVKGSTSADESTRQHTLQVYRSAMEDWTDRLNAEASTRYRRDLDEARKKARDRAESAANVDFSALRGRGAEFVLEFTAVVVIIFAAVVLGVLQILKTEQIGTLLAAIAGYVLGRATSRSNAPATAEPAARTPQGDVTGKAATAVAGKTP